MAEDMMTYVKIAKYIGAAGAIALGTFGPTYAQGLIGSRGCESIGKYPEVSNRIQTAMFTGLAMVETSALFAFIIAILLIFS